MNASVINIPPDYITIPVPVHPDDKDLPLSFVQLKMPSGKVFEITIPIQGAKTLQNVINTLEIWRPTLVKNDDALKDDGQGTD